MLEIWKDIPWYEGLYKVSDYWNVRSFCVKKEGRSLKLRTDNCGYHEAKLYKDRKEKCYRVNRLVYFTFSWGDLNFYDPRKKTVVCHKNDIRKDNRLDNLFLWTQKDNIQDLMNKIKEGKRQPVWVGVNFWSHRCKPILQFDKNGVFIKEWKSSAEVARHIWVNYRIIYKYLKWLSEHNTFIFKYKKED